MRRLPEGYVRNRIEDMLWKVEDRAWKKSNKDVTVTASDILNVLVGDATIGEVLSSLRAREGRNMIFVDRREGSKDLQPLLRPRLSLSILSLPMPHSMATARKET